MVNNTVEVELDSNELNIDEPTADEQTLDESATENKEATPVIVTVDNEDTLQNRQEIINDITEFRDRKVYVTKKTRMNSEVRLNRNNIHSIILVNVYTFTILCYSIISIKYEANDIFTLMSVIVSVALFGVSLFVSLYGFREKALAFKNSYLEMSGIENKLSILLLRKDLSNEELTSKFSEYQDNYTEILNKIDNHVEKDFIKYKVNSNNVTAEDIIKHGFHKFLSIIMWGIFYSIPVISLIIILFTL